MASAEALGQGLPKLSFDKTSYRVPDDIFNPVSEVNRRMEVEPMTFEFAYAPTSAPTEVDHLIVDGTGVIGKWSEVRNDGEGLDTSSIPDPLADSNPLTYADEQLIARIAEEQAEIDLGEDANTAVTEAMAALAISGAVEG